MQKPVLAAGIALFAIVIAGILVLQSSKNPPKKESKLLKVYFTCDTRGRLEPCGCFTGQMGGLTRAHTWLLRNGEANSLRVDVGGAIGGDQDYHVIQYRYLQKAYQRMGYHALNLGAAEAQLSANTLRELISEAQLPLLSASLVDISSRKPIAQPTAKIKIQGRTIGLLGVVDPRSVNAPGEGVAILSLNDAISRHLPALHAECDEVVLLCFAKEAEMERIANQFYEFALIVGGDVGQPSQKAEVFNDTLIVFTTNQARTVGEISFRRRNDSLEVEAYDIHRLYADVAQSEELTSLSKEFRTFIKTATLDIDNPNRTNEGSIPGVKPLASFVGSQSCVQCHVEEAEIWKNSGHSHAFNTLVRRESEADPTCIGCHTIGFGKPTGYQRSFGNEQLTDVGCESCHGPGSEHVTSWAAGKKPAFQFRPLGPGDCKSCHHGEFSRPFEWDKFWPLIAHGKNKAPSTREAKSEE